MVNLGERLGPLERLEVAYKRRREMATEVDGWLAEAHPLWEMVGMCTERSRSK